MCVELKLNTKSPCIKVCKLKDGYCIGCKRSIYEISNWSKMTDEEKIRINKEVKKR